MSELLTPQGRDVRQRALYSGVKVNAGKGAFMADYTNVIVITLFILFFVTLNIVEKGRWD